MITVVLLGWIVRLVGTHPHQELPSVQSILETGPRPQYCDVGHCRDWMIVVVLSLSTKFPQSDFAHIGRFFQNAWNQCEAEHGLTTLGFTSLRNHQNIKWFYDLSEFRSNFDSIDYRDFVDKSKPTSRDVTTTIMDVSDALSKFKDRKFGHYVVFISDFDFYLSIDEADRVRARLIHQQVRLKLVNFDDYFEDEDKSDSKENFFEMIAENGEIVGVNKAKDLVEGNTKLVLKLYPCQNGLQEHGSLRIGSYGPGPPPDHRPMPVWPFAVGGSVLILLLMAIPVACFVRKRLRKRHALSTLRIIGNVDMNEYIQIENKDWIIESPNLFIDFSRKLGSGAFSYVYYGRLKGRAPVCDIHSKIVDTMAYTNCEVAVKVLPQFADGMAKSDFLQEVNLMKALVQHTHLLRMLGVCQKPEADVCLVLEYCQNGDLLNFVRSNKDLILMGSAEHFKFKDLLGLCWQIADGMYFLNSKDLIHRDLAARNVFITENMTAKIGDFGLCRLTNASIYQTRGEKMPVKWTALESLKDHAYTSKSDVWSYGILLFEIFSLGEVPYADVPIQELLAFLESGSRLKQPKCMPNDLAELMLWCWKEAPADRPSFKVVRTELATMLSNCTEHYGYVNPSYSG